jgi:hypothetical protein
VAIVRCSPARQGLANPLEKGGHGARRRRRSAGEGASAPIYARAEIGLGLPHLSQHGDRWRRIRLKCPQLHACDAPCHGSLAGRPLMSLAVQAGRLFKFLLPSVLREAAIEAVKGLVRFLLKIML